jgi:hypothetical protein
MFFFHIIEIQQQNNNKSFSENIVNVKNYFVFSQKRHKSTKLYFEEEIVAFE